jgi:hypothetical protein
MEIGEACLEGALGHLSSFAGGLMGLMGGRVWLLTRCRKDVDAVAENGVCRTNLGYGSREGVACLTPAAAEDNRNLKRITHFDCTVC